MYTVTIGPRTPTHARSERSWRKLATSECTQACVTQPTHPSVLFSSLLLFVSCSLLFPLLFWSLPPFIFHSISSSLSPSSSLPIPLHIHLHIPFHIFPSYSSPSPYLLLLLSPSSSLPVPLHIHFHVPFHIFPSLPFPFPFPLLSPFPLLIQYLLRSFRLPWSLLLFLFPFPSLISSHIF